MATQPRPWLPLGRMTIKRALKRAAGWAAVSSLPLVLRRGTGPRVCILVYHRVADVGFTDPRVDDWCVPPRVFESQIAALTRIAEVIPLRDVPARLREKEPPDRPLVCLTFDDGYRNFATQVLPVLERHRLPAALFVVTSQIGSSQPMPFDGWALRNRGRASSDAWLPIDWSAIETCQKSGLVTIGSHSHQHRDGRLCDEAALAEEAATSRDILVGRLGDSEVFAYAYPYGSSRLGHASPAYQRAVKEAGYALGLSTDLGLAAGTSDPYCLPRVEAHPLDSPAVLRAKALGALGPYWLTDQLRRAERSPES